MHQKAYLFTSERMGFRLWREDDLEEFAKLNADKAVMEHFPKTLTLEESKQLIERLKAQYAENGFTYYATDLLKTGELIGMIGLAYQTYPSEFTPAIDIGWRLKKDVWGNGYATEGATKCLEFAFNELMIDQVIAVCTLTNYQSENVMKKLGMKKLGEFNHPKLSNRPELERHVCYEIKRKA
jgi:RimJ/RimL family protein N-acetyltransferase